MTRNENRTSSGDTTFEVIVIGAGQSGLVTRVTREGADFTVHTDRDTHHASRVVLATGPFRPRRSSAAATGSGA